MNGLCHALHQVAAQLHFHSFPFVESAVPENGIYILFEEGENAHDLRRIVRIGTHTGGRQLRPRLRQHFVQENKDRSIFRKNIGRALLHQASDPFLSDWNLDLTTTAQRVLHASRINHQKQRFVESAVTAYIQSRFCFVVIPVPTKIQRLLWESRMVSTIAACPFCKPSPGWLGCSSPIAKIRTNGLWQVNELFKEPFSESEFVEFKQKILGL